MKLKNLILAVSTLTTASLAMGADCGEFTFGPDEMAVSKNGGDINNTTGLMTVSTEKSGGDEEHDTVKFIARLPSPAESGLNSVTADLRILSGLVHQTVVFSPIPLGYSQSGVDITLKVFSRVSGRDRLLCENKMEWKKGGEPSSTIQLPTGLHSLSCEFDALRSVPNVRAELSLHGWSIAGGAAGAKSNAQVNLRGITANLCQDI